MTATAGNGNATVSWTAPPDDGSPIISYTITPYIGDRPRLAGHHRHRLAPVDERHRHELTNGTAYTFTVTATNLIGTGPASSASNAVTPAAPTAPGAPTGVTATAGNGKATVTWTAPSNGGSTITSYTITPYIGSTAQTASPPPSPAPHP